MDEQVKRDAYLRGLKLKNTGLDEETIFIRLEKQGVPSDLAKEVAKNVFLQRQIDNINNQPAPIFFASKRPLIETLIVEIKFWLQNRKSKKGH
jgi:hypothetical protein